MREIVLISGKGGTGKTSLTAAFSKLADSSMVADCDVDAADLHLLLKPISGAAVPFFAGEVASINQEHCRQCGRCAEVCRFAAVTADAEGFSIDPVLCVGCGVCSVACPADAVVMKRCECGSWSVSGIESSAMVHARLYPGEENSGKLVALVRKEAKRVCEERGDEWLLVDGPPGIGCPVIASVTGCDGVVIITEPTRSGKHDLTRILKLVSLFRIPALVVINKADISKEIAAEIEEISGAYQAEIAGEIIYSPIFSQALSRGQTIVEFAPETLPVQSVRAIWQEIENYFQPSLYLDESFA